MPSADAVLTRSGPVGVPLDYTVPVGGEIQPISVTASFDGSSALVSFLPTLEVIAQNGAVIARCPLFAPIPAGGSGDVSWFPGVVETATATNVVTVGALVKRPQASPQSIPSSASFTAISFTSVQFDTNGMFSAGSPTRLTCQIAGVYLITGSVGFVNNNVGDRAMTIRLNGATQLGESESPAPGNFFWSGFAAASINMAVGDYVEDMGAQNSGGNLNTGDCWFGAFAVGAPA